MSRFPIRSALRAAGVAAALFFTAGALGGCVVVIDDDMGMEYAEPNLKATRSQTIAHVEDKPVDVTTENGSVSIKKTDAKEVKITTRLQGQSQERLDKAVVSASRHSDGTLQIKVIWPDGKRKNNEGASFEIETPGFTGVKVSSSNGAISLADLKGDATLDTSNGAISVKNHDGAVKAVSSNGAIDLANVMGASADSSNGPITIALNPKAAGPVKADTSNGPIHLKVGSAFTGAVNAETSNGVITNTSPRGVPSPKNSKTEASFQFGEGGKKSKLSTSNGPIDISDAT
ncbi:MAG: DUF4097 family beta strand repeat protein [Planctomycetes bacterium]|nr:DUF4097 family beta strand repeat protein [Planctomycetota bacterium]